MKADNEDMVFVDVSLTDNMGIVKNLEDQNVTVQVTGAAKLAGIGNKRSAFSAVHRVPFYRVCAYARRANGFLGDSLVESAAIDTSEGVIVLNGGIGGLHRCGCGH